MVLFLILELYFLDAYDITILGTMTDQLTQQFHLSPNAIYNDLFTYWCIVWCITLVH